jgi:hypothetical protein
MTNILVPGPCGHSGSRILDQHEVTTDALLALFRRAFLTAHIDDDGDIYITDGLGFPIWVSVDTGQRLIRYFTFMRREDQPPFTAAAANHVNATVVLPTFYVQSDHKDRLCSDYVMTFADGVIESHIIKMARRFARASVYAAERLDEYALPIGAIPSEGVAPCKGTKDDNLG